MPSPIPGMDPYLEHPAVFPGVHDGFIAYLAESLNQRLPTVYYAAIANRVWVELTDRNIEPDVNVLHQTNGPPAVQGNGGVFPSATVVEAMPVRIVVPKEEIKETYIEVFASGDQTPQLVAIIELLSRANKTPKSEGRKLYRQKQREVHKSGAHLLEIDLLRWGTHTTSVPLDHVRAKAGPFDYHACLRRAKRSEELLVYPIRLGEQLPAIGLPLLPDDGKVLLDLQAVLDRTYDTGRFRQRIRYDQLPPPPAFTPEQTAWLDTVRRERGLIASS